MNRIENGTIFLSFKFDCVCTHNIEYYEIYYCYINDSDDNWYKYAQNNCRNIVIPSNNQINKNHELRIQHLQHFMMKLKTKILN